MYLDKKHLKQIDSHTRRFNPTGWRLEPATLSGAGFGFIRLYAMFGTERREIFAMRVNNPSMANDVYHELTRYLADRKDWGGIKESDADAEGKILEGANIDWDEL